MISIIIPVYNVARYLREAVDSAIVAAEKCGSFELILVDDESTDGSLEIEREYAAKDPRIRLIERTHTNAGACRNAGIEVATGDWLAFLDADDVFAPAMLKELIDSAESNHADIATCGFRRFDDGQDYQSFLKGAGATFKVIDDPANNVDIFAHWVGWAWDKVFRRELVEKHGLRFQEVTSSNDLRFVYSALALADCVVETETSFIAHRMHSSSLQATRKKIPTNFLNVLRSYRDEMTKRGVFERSPNLLQAYLRYVVRFTIFQLDYIGDARAHDEVRRCAAEYWRELSIDKQVTRLCGAKARIRCQMVLKFPYAEDLYYRCVKRITCNSKIRHAVKTLLSIGK